MYLLFNGSLFCAYPNGECRLFKLRGTAYPPKYTSIITWHCTARQKMCGVVSLYNWSPGVETFSVKLAINSVSTPIYYILDAADSISIPGKQKRKFNIGFVCFKECEILLNAIFKNINSGEYQIYKITIISKPPGTPPRSLVPAKEKLIYKIPFNNPMNKKTTFVLECLNPYILNGKKIIRVKPRRKVLLSLKMVTLATGTPQDVSVTTYNHLLGISTYKFHLNPMKAAHQEEIFFSTEIGRTTSYTLPIRNVTSVVATGFLQADSSDILMGSKIFNIPPHRTLKLRVKFRPSFIGVMMKNIAVYTTCLGKFNFALKCIGHLPKPQGTYLVPNGGFFAISFVNVLNVKGTFQCETNSTEFLVRTTTFNLSPDERLSIEIQHLPFNIGVENSLNLHESYCKFTVTCTNYVPNIQWIYYLKTKSSENK